MTTGGRGRGGGWGRRGRWSLEPDAQRVVVEEGDGSGLGAQDAFEGHPIGLESTTDVIEGDQAVAMIEHEPGGVVATGLHEPGQDDGRGDGVGRPERALAHPLGDDRLEDVGQGGTLSPAELLSDDGIAIGQPDVHEGEHELALLRFPRGDVREDVVQLGRGRTRGILQDRADHRHRRVDHPIEDGLKEIFLRAEVVVEGAA